MTLEQLKDDWRDSKPGRQATTPGALVTVFQHAEHGAGDTACILRVQYVDPYKGVDPARVTVFPSRAKSVFDSDEDAFAFVREILGLSAPCP